MSPHTSTNPHLSLSDKETEMERNKRLYFDSDTDVVAVEKNNIKEKNGTSFSEFRYRGGSGSVDCLSSSSSNSKNHEPSTFSSSSSSSGMTGRDDRSNTRGNRYYDLSHEIGRAHV